MIKNQAKKVPKMHESSTPDPHKKSTIMKKWARHPKHVSQTRV